jgi:MFS family permease
MTPPRQAVAGAGTGPDVELADIGSRRPGSPAAALAHRSFRWVYLGSFASNIGTWMQNFTLGALADQMTGKSWYIGLVTFAQLGPMLLLSPWAGVIADAFDRKRIMLTAAGFQAVFSCLLAWAALSEVPSRLGIVGLVFVIGVAGALNAPAANATLPALVGRRELPGAISLNSFQMNASRVVGPLLAGLVVGIERPSAIFLVNAATYLFVIAAVSLVRFESRPTATDTTEGPLTRFRLGIVAARADRIIWRVLVTVSVYSLCSLIFIYQMHPFAIRRLGGTGTTFTILFSAFGLGAALGAIAVGTVLAALSRPRLTRWGLIGFAVSLAVFATSTSPVPAYIAAFVTGWCYFVVITCLSTILQERVDDAVRGRVMGLWMMGWAGLVPLGSLIGGPIIDAVGLVWVFLFGAAVAGALAVYADLEPLVDDGPVVPPASLLDP